MCSVHTCVVHLLTVLQGITTAIAFQHGMGSSAFALAVALSSIVMYDAAGVRRHAGVSWLVHVQQACMQLVPGMAPWQHCHHNLLGSTCRQQSLHHLYLASRTAPRWIQLQLKRPARGHCRSSSEH